MFPRAVMSRLSGTKRMRVSSDADMLPSTVIEGSSERMSESPPCALRRMPSAFRATSLMFSSITPLREFVRKASKATVISSSRPLWAKVACGMMTSTWKAGSFPVAWTKSPLTVASSPMTASVLIWSASGMKFLTNFFMMSFIWHSVTESSPFISVLPSWNLRSASPSKGRAAISALKLWTPRAGTLSFGKWSVVLRLIGMFIRPNALVAKVVFASASRSMWSSCSWMWSMFRPKASVSAATLPATNILSTERPRRFFELFLVDSLPSKTACFSSMKVKIVSLLSVYTICELSVMPIFPMLIFGRTSAVVSSSSSALPKRNMFQFVRPFPYAWAKIFGPSRLTSRTIRLPNRTGMTLMLVENLENDARVSAVSPFPLYIRMP